MRFDSRTVGQQQEHWASHSMPLARNSAFHSRSRWKSNNRLSQSASSVRIWVLPVAIIPIAFLLCLHLRWNLTTSPSSELQDLRVSVIRPNKPFDFMLSACVIVRDSSDIMAEFLIRNYLAGVDHFYIYGDDNDQTEISRLSKLFVALTGIVTYIQNGREVPKDDEDMESYVQMRMYRHCLEEFGSTSKWMALIDTDEFFETSSSHLIEEESAQRAPVAFMHTFLKAHHSVPVVCIRWKTALTNGELQPPRPGQILDDIFPLTCKVQLNNKEKLALRKTVLQPKYIDFDASPKLDVAIHKGFRFKDEKEKYQCIWGLGHDLEPAVHLVHYWSRDLSSYLRKIKRGRPRRSVPSRTLEDLFTRESLCESERDTSPRLFRNEALRSLLRRLPLPPVHSYAYPNYEEIIAPNALSSQFKFCAPHVARYISEIKSGKLFSNEMYCRGRKTKACLLARHNGAWPFPWAEYLLSCDVGSKNATFFTKNKL